MTFREVVIESRDPAEAARFYRDTFGLRVDDERVFTGESVLRFEQGTPNGPYHLAFNIPSNQISEAKAWLQARVPVLVEDIFDFDFWNAKAIYFEDVDGNILELIARHNLANAADAPFDASSILSISEFGLPVADPLRTIDALERDLALSVYSGDRDSFTAVGDERGLFIVVRPGRHWFPTDRPAATNAAEVSIDAGGRGPVVVDGPVRIRGVER
jgi:catechol 2,3-dioxygenase-like lactoylglutathione lyase family enzyme